MGIDIFFFVDATTLLGTNRKTESEDIKSTDTKAPKKLTQDDFKTVYVSKISPAEEKEVSNKEPIKNKMIDLDNDQYEVVDTSYVTVHLKHK